MVQKIIKTGVLIILLTLCLNVCFASNEGSVEKISDSLGVSTMLNTLKQYTGDLDLDSISNSLLSGEGANYGVIGNFVLKHILIEIKVGIKTAISIVIILVLLAVMKSLELEKDGTLANVTKLISFLLIVTMLLKNYDTNIALFSETVNSLTKIVSVISPLLLSILIATGEVVTSGIISPIIMFLTGAIGVLVSKIIIPLLTLSLVLNIITNCSNAVKLDKLSSLCKSSAMWIVSVVFALFLGVLGLESSVATSVDGVTVKTAQAAVSNLVPVVGKFLSDSLEVVMGSSELIGKSVGVIGIIALFVVLVVPLVKLIVISIIYKLLEVFSEAILAEEKISKLIGAFAKQYSSIVGIMVGIGATFVIAIGLVMNLFGKALGG